MDIQTITSVDNVRIKHIKKLLADKKYRQQHGEFVAEGVRWVADTTQKFSDNLVGIYVANNSVIKAKHLLQGFDFNKVFIVSDFIMDNITDTKQTQGILAVLKIPLAPKAIHGTQVLYLDSVRDPGNLGTIIRTAAASGYTDILLHNCVDPFNPKVVRSTMGALLSITIRTDVEVTMLSFLKQLGYCVFAAMLQGENVFTYAEKHDKIILLVGSEATGISSHLVDLADVSVSIPMQNKVESLNAGVSASILMYQLQAK